MNRSLGCWNGAGKRRGFTLVEMLVTISIIVVIASIMIPVFAAGRTRTRRTEATNAVMAALASAREAAVERRTIVAVEFISDPMSPDRGDMMVIVDKTLSSVEPRYDATTGQPGLRRIGAPIPLPDFIKFDLASAASDDGWTLSNGWNGDDDDSQEFSLSANAPPPYPDIAYMPDGTVADPEGYTDIVLIDKSEPAREKLRVLPATGLVIRARHKQDPYQPEGPTNPRTTGRGDNWI